MASSVRSRPESPREWSPEDVVEFLTDPKEVGLPQSAAAAFSANQIDGRALLELTTEEVRSELGLVLGHRKTLFRAISRLKAMSKVTATKADQNSAQTTTSSPPGTAVSSSERKSEAAANSPESPASRETSAAVGATSATPRSATADTAAELTCAGCGCTKSGELFSSRQRKIAAHKPARCIECAQAGAAATSSRSAPTELQPYLARELRPAEAAGYKASGVLPMRRAHDGTLEVLLALERRQDWAIRGRGEKGAAKSKAEQDNAGDSKTLLAASGRVEGDFLHPIGGTREADDAGAVATAAREFAEEVGHVLSTEADGSNTAALAQASTEMLKGARGRYVLWQPRGKYALWVYFLPAEQQDVADKFAAWKAQESKDTHAATSTAGEQRMLDVRWVPVSMDGTVQIDQHTKPETSPATVHGQATDGRLATSFCIELLQRKALRQHLAQTARRFLRLQLSVGSASPGKGSDNASTPSTLAQSPMLAVAAEALLSKRLAAATPSPTQKQQRKSKKRKAGDSPSQSNESCAKDAPTEVEGAAVGATAAAAEADDAAARKQAKKRAKKQRKQPTKTKRKSDHSRTEDNDEGDGSKDNGPAKRLRAEEMKSKNKRKAEPTTTDRMNSNASEAASDTVEQRPMPGDKEVKDKNKEVSTTAESENSQQKDTGAATVDQTDAADRSHEHQQLFVEDREGSRAQTDHAASATDAVDVAAPKTLNRAVRKQQRKLAHAERLKAKAAAADSEAAALLVPSATQNNETRAAKRTQAVLTVSKPAPSIDTTLEEPLPSPRVLGKFRFTGTGLHIG